MFVPEPNDYPQQKQLAELVLKETRVVVGLSIFPSSPAVTSFDR